MVQKLKDVVDDAKIVQVVTHSASQIWLAGLGAFAKAQAEGTKMFDALVKEGEALQARAGKAASAQITEVSKSAAGAWDKLEQVFEERVSKSLNRLGVPTYADIQKLSKQVNELNDSVQELLQSGRTAQQASARRAGKGSKGAKEAARPA
jgi:poly(hydroxyalkanoate) granule-associated protein